MHGVQGRENLYRLKLLVGGKLYSRVGEYSDDVGAVAPQVAMESLLFEYDHQSMPHASVFDLSRSLELQRQGSGMRLGGCGSGKRPAQEMAAKGLWGGGYLEQDLDTLKRGNASAGYSPR
jgi:hypothetical protein